MQINIPTMMLSYTGGNKQISVDGSTVKEALNKLEIDYPNIRNILYSDNGKLRRNINLYVNNEDIRFLNNEDTNLSVNDELTIIPAIAGG